MTIVTRTGLRAALVCLAAFAGWWNAAEAQMTPAGTSIANRATVDYSVGGQAQTAINSSPTGNTVPGPAGGADTAFLVDNLVDLTVAELSLNATITSPGAANGVLAYTVINTGNSPQGYQLTFTEEVATLLFLNTDNVDFGNLVIRVDEDPSGGDGTGNDTYDGTETDTAIDTLNPGQSITVFVVSPTVPLTLADGSYANVRLQAQTAVPGTGGSTLEVESVGLNDPTTIEVLFADAGNDGLESDVDQFAVQSAALLVSKAQEVLDDGFGSASPRAIPGALVEYTITIENSSTTTAADAVAVSDPIPANTTFQSGLYGGDDVAITGGAAATCAAETPADSNGDGCFINGGNLTVGGAALGSIAAGATVTVRFQVLID